MPDRTLRLLRNIHGLKTAQVAERMGIKPRKLNEIERSETPPSLEMQQKLAQALGMKLSDLQSACRWQALPND